MAIDTNIFLQIDANETDQKVLLGKELISLRMSAETNARVLRNHVDRLTDILNTHGVDAPTPLFNLEETQTIKGLILFLINGGGPARVDGQPFEGFQAIIDEVQLLAQ